MTTLVEKIVELQKRSKSDSVHGKHDCRPDMQTDGGKEEYSGRKEQLYTSTPSL